jgi:hypothetical protein
MHELAAPAATASHLAIVDLEPVRLAWVRFNEFETWHRGHDAPAFAEFMAEWEARRRAAHAAGLQYSDSVLAYKLLHAAKLEPSQLDLVFTSVDFSSGKFILNLSCGSKTIFFGSGSHFRQSFGSGSSLTSKKLRIQLRIRP